MAEKATGDQWRDHLISALHMMELDAIPIPDQGGGDR